MIFGYIILLFAVCSLGLGFLAWSIEKVDYTLWKRRF